MYREKDETRVYHTKKKTDTLCEIISECKIINLFFYLFFSNFFLAHIKFRF